MVRKYICKEKCIIITTINKPSETIIKHINNINYDVIIIGDNKTPNDYQIRNEHNLMNDFKDEIEMYFHNENILNFIDENNNDIITIKDLLKNIYKNLLKNNIIIEKEIEVLNKWLSYF